MSGRFKMMAGADSSGGTADRCVDLQEELFPEKYKGPYRGNEKAQDILQ